MGLNPEKYTTFVFDLDGTLYDQPLLRRIMAVRLFRYYVCHPFSIRDAFVLKRFRSVKDKWDESDPGSGCDDSCDYALIDELDRRICCHVAKIMNKCPEYVCDIVYRWIYENPLSAIKMSRDARLIGYIASIRAKGKRVLILSDYPVSEKLKALECEADGIYSATDKRINELKPSPKGLKIIMQDYELNSAEMLMIGDRMEKDGEAAKAAGCDYIIVPRKLKDRSDFYKITGA